MASDLSETMRLPPIGFWSYARPNEGAEGRLGDILRQIRLELSQHFVDLEIYQDIASNRHGEEWQKRIDDEIARSTFFIPILTPHFVQSKWCLHEVERFLAREQALFAAHPDLPRTSRIFPIHYVEIDDAPSLRPDLVAILTQRNWFDMREMRYEARVDIGDAGRAIGNYARSIRSVLSARVAAPPSPEEIRAHEAEVIRLDSQYAAVAEAQRAHRGEPAGRVDTGRREEAGAAGRDPLPWPAFAVILAVVAVIVAALVFFNSRPEPVRPTARALSAGPTPAPAPSPTVDTSVTIQFGSFPTEDAARSAWKRIAARNAAISKLRWYIETAEVNGRTFYRLKARARDEDQAVLLCNALKLSGEFCILN